MGNSGCSDDSPKDFSSLASLRKKKLNPFTVDDDDFINKNEQNTFKNENISGSLNIEEAIKCEKEKEKQDDPNKSLVDQIKKLEIEKLALEKENIILDKENQKLLIFERNCQSYGGLMQMLEKKLQVHVDDLQKYDQTELTIQKFHKMTNFVFKKDRIFEHEEKIKFLVENTNELIKHYEEILKTINSHRIINFSERLHFYFNKKKKLEYEKKVAFLETIKVSSAEKMNKIKKENDIRIEKNKKENEKKIAQILEESALCCVCLENRRDICYVPWFDFVFYNF